MSTEKKLTAMQELLDWLQDPTITSNQDKYNCIEKVKELLQKEKQQIIDAYDEGYSDGMYENEYDKGEQYYEETYKKD